VVQKKVFHGLVNYPSPEGGLRIAQRGQVVNVAEGPELDRLVRLGALVPASEELDIPEPERRETIPINTVTGGPVLGPVGNGDPTALARVQALEEAAALSVGAISGALDDIETIELDDADARDDVAPAPSFPTVEAKPVAKPVRVADKASWVAYAASLPGSPPAEDIDKMTKTEIYETYGGK
jgi:hypothetical protein